MRYILMGVKDSIAGYYDRPVAYFTSKQKLDDYLSRYKPIEVNGIKIFPKDSVLNGFSNYHVQTTTLPIPPVDPE
jgi:hypothetical protein